jgi:hypothetical protein
MSDTFSSLLKATLCSRPNPVFFWREQGQMVAVAAANLWTLALKRRHELRNSGVRPDDIWSSSALDFSFIVDLVACAIGGNPFFPSSNKGYPIEKNTGITNTAPNSKNEKLQFTGPRRPCLIFQMSDINLTTVISTEQVLSHLYRTLKVLRPSPTEIRLSCLKPHNAPVFINDVLCGMLTGQTIYIDFKGDTIQNIERLDKVIREDDISTLAITPSMCKGLAMTPLQIKERFSLKTVYSVETLEIY